MDYSPYNIEMNLLNSSVTDSGSSVLSIVTPNYVGENNDMLLGVSFFELELDFLKEIVNDTVKNTAQSIHHLSNEIYSSVTQATDLITQIV